MKLKNYAGHMTAPEFREQIKAARGVIVLGGSCEQHGHHLPLDTDNIIGLELALKIAEQTDMIVMPPVNYGQVWSAKGFPGTICLSSGTLKLLLKEIIMNLEQQKARHIILMSGHNGNYPVFKELARDLLDEYGWENVWHFPLPISKELMDKAQSPLPSLANHAGEIETSMLMYLRPDLADLSKATKEFPQPPRDYPFRPMHWNAFLESGSFGDGGSASLEYGKELCEYAVETTVQRIREFLN